MVKRAIVKTKKFFLYLKYLFFENFPKVLDKDESIALIINKKLCVARYGDGEFHLMVNSTNDLGFQTYSKQLADKLRESFLSTNCGRLLICSHDFDFKNYNNKVKAFKRWHTNYTLDTYPSIKIFFDKKYIYGCAEITRFYFPLNFANTDFCKVEEYVHLFRKIWDKRNLLIVEGDKTLLGCGSDLFSNANDIKRIICPSTNAFEVYDDIYNSILDYSYNSASNKDLLVLIALGPAASVLATDIAKNTNIQAIDIGHLDIVYLWFIHKSTKCVGISGKHVNEKNVDEDIAVDIDYDKYQSEIIKNVLPRANK